MNTKNTPLKPYQIEGVRFLSSRYHALLADDMGLGKTLQVIRAIEQVKAQRIVIVCPASVRDHWKTSFYTYAREFYAINTFKCPSPVNFNQADLFIVSYDMLREFCQADKREFDVLVCDEAHYLKSIEAQRTEAVLGTHGLARRCKYKWMLTGTPITNRPIDLYPLLVSLASKHISPYLDYEAFGLRFCNAFYNKFGEFVALGASNTDDLARRLQSFMLRRTKAEVLSDFETVDREIISLQPTPEIINLLEKEKRVRDSKVTLDMGRLAELRQQYALAKMPLVIKEVRRLLKETEKVVVFAHHREVVLGLFEALLEFDPVYYMGGMSDKEKSEAIQIFSTKEVMSRLFIGNLSAAATGIDGLQTVCSTVVFAEWGWTPAEIQQGIDRLSRMGQKEKVNAIFLVIPGSLEEKMLKSTNSKQKVITSILGD